MTMSEVIEKVNRQLSALNEARAEVNAEVVCSLLREGLQAALRNSPALLNMAKQWAEDWNMNIGEADLATITLLDVQPGGPYTGTAGVGIEIYVGTWMGGCREGLWSVYPDLVAIWGPKEEHTPARIIDRKFGLWVAVKAALEKQETQGLQVTDRWLMAPEQFRAAPPICPQCGAPTVRLADYGRDGTYLGCDTCGWHAHAPALGSVAALTEESVFKAELDVVRQAKEAEMALQKVLDELMEKAEELPGMVEEYRRFRLPSGDMVRTMQAINSKIGDASSLMRGIHFGFNKEP